MTSLTLTLSLVYPTMFISLRALYICLWPIPGATIRDARTFQSGSRFFGSHCTPQDCTRKGGDWYPGRCLVEGCYKWYQAQWWPSLLFNGFLEWSCSIKESFPRQNEIGHPFRQLMCTDYLAGYLSKDESSKYRVGLPHKIQFLTSLTILIQNAQGLAWDFGDFSTQNSYPWWMWCRTDRRASNQDVYEGLPTSLLQ